MSYVTVSDMYSDGSYCAPATEYERILHDVESRAEWLRFTTVDGAEIMLRTDAVLSINYISDEAAAALEERESRARIE